MVRLIPTGYEALDTNSDEEDEVYRTNSSEDLGGQTFGALAPRGLKNKSIFFIVNSFSFFNMT